MDRIRAIIVDDEPLARERIRSLLEDESDFEILAECANGKEAIGAIESLEPDLVFLDVQMPAMDGFEVLASLDQETLPSVVFVTAYDQYAVKAFEVHALDYLLKPFDGNRFSSALDRARKQVERARSGLARTELIDLVKEMRSEQPGQQRLLIKTEGKVVFVSTDQIGWVEAAGNYVRVHTRDDVYLMRETMSGMVSRLPRDRFVRIHRSTMVNFDDIKELLPTFNNEFMVVLRSGEKLKLSRKYRPDLERRLGRSL